MIDHEAFPVDPWKVIESEFRPDLIGETETLFSVANGYVGLRGNLEEGEPVFQYGTLVNGMYEIRPIVYGEKAFGYAKCDQTIINVTDGKPIRLTIDGEPLDLRQGSIVAHRRELDMQTGILSREFQWATPSGHRVRVKTERFVSFKRRNVACLRFEFEVMDKAAHVAVVSELVGNESNQLNVNDPRASAALFGRVLKPVAWSAEDRRIVMAHATDHSELMIGAGMDHHFWDFEPRNEEIDHSPDRASLTFDVDAEPGTPLRFAKFLAYHHADADADADAHCGAVEATLAEAREAGFDALRDEQTRFVATFWEANDVVLDGDDSLQQAVRFSIFQILQASACIDTTSIPAKGLTGQGYEGHYFWDTEIFAMPFLTYSRPEIAKQVLEYRHSILPEARERAETLSQQGALFPWRTINGHEASAFFPAGTAAYHIDADIAYAVRRYTRAVDDAEFADGDGAEILVETARMWKSLGYFNDARDGAFCINEVTGPDEYTALVDNNLYTNMMARENLWCAAAEAGRIKSENPDAYQLLIDNTGLADDEPAGWKEAADKMWIGFDDERQIHKKDDSFLEKELWDFDNTPPDKYPLLLNFHPLVIYRYQVIKQADLVLAMQLLGKHFEPDQVRRNFDYYSGVTVNDSSLSASTQCVVACSIGETEQAHEALLSTARMDLDDVEHNVRDGVHIAASSGTWVAMIYGFGGFRDWDDTPSFVPRLPDEWNSLAYSITWRGSRVNISIAGDEATYTLVDGEPLTIRHWGKKAHLDASKSVTHKIPALEPVS